MGSETNLKEQSALMGGGVPLKRALEGLCFISYVQVPTESTDFYGPGLQWPAEAPHTSPLFQPAH